MVNEFIEEKTVVGKGIDITKATMVSSQDIIFTNSVYDVDLLNAMGKWASSNVTSNSEKVEVVAGNTVTETMKKFNSNNEVGYSGFGFSGSVNVNYSSSRLEVAVRASAFGVSGYKYFSY